MVADGQLIVLSERVLLALTETTPDEYREKSFSPGFIDKYWTMPTLVNGKLYLPNQKALICLNIKAAG